MQNMFISLFSIAMLLATGCGYQITNYGLSARNLESMKSIASKTNNKVQVGEFTSNSPSHATTSILCRAAGPVNIPEGKTFTSYIKEAFEEEARISGLLSKSGVKMSAHLNYIDFSSGMTDGGWQFKIKVTMNNRSFLVESRTNFSGSFIADKACQQTAQAFPAAVQDLIKKIHAVDKG